jgi:hypothetical protein
MKSTTRSLVKWQCFNSDFCLWLWRSGDPRDGNGAGLDFLRNPLGS